MKSDTIVYLSKGPLVMHTIYRALILAGLLAIGSHPGNAQNLSKEQAEVSQRLDLLHEMASKGDFDAYFGLYDETAIFIGTDATERWTLNEFQDYTRPVFAQGRGWTYLSTARNVYVSRDGDMAWFDEMLENEKLGVTRGTGTLIKKDGEWKIVQYHLTIPVPNQLAREFVALIRSMPENE